ncbi:primosomal protein N' [Marinobacterium aestuarii]|uniref:Replication restart protein PriA n=1 Tax=Marinobacterium aestuarii TaxID=1821621 RepID=A0A1A9EUX7_9GAMM|nr:primosomal protein N' [Marinobacterium aestuarii]ANG61343.1 primosomal protein N' [Marinobacterium aestuarii]
MTILRIALPTPLRRLFDYLPPASGLESIPAIGVRIRVPFGRRELTGVLIEVAQTSEFPLTKLKPALEILDQTPPLPPHLLELACWAADYYQHPVGDALHQALPVLLRKGESDQPSPQLRWHAAPGISSDAVAPRAKKQRALLEWLLQHPEGLDNPTIRSAGYSSAQQKLLSDRGLIEERAAVASETIATPAQTELLRQPLLPLNAEQQQALEAIFERDGFNPVLLQGITGSGKTEVYLQAIERVLHQGGQALVLVPEIGLTPQTVSRFRSRFKVEVQVLHSNMTDRQRLDAWLQARSGQARVVIGTRSALFTPLKTPGIIIVDEEHDTSFKQQDGFRYSARDLAVMRARAENIPLVLGTATPSLETLHNAQSGRYRHVRLNQRAGNARPPGFELYDIRQQPLNSGLSDEVVRRIGIELQQGNQVLLFLNRRGFSPALMCHQCGTVIECDRCDARMTLHRTPPHLHCHHCDHQRPIPHRCPSCHTSDFKPQGAGTERTEGVLQQLFPDTDVIRVDRDSTQRRNAMQDIMERVHDGRPCILVGTQMLAKGHHFPAVTLVVILDADAGLFSADFRGMERTAQLILQVAGRAGRAERPGQVLMQTHHADHPTLIQLVNQGYEAFATAELKLRQNSGLPPFIYHALLRAEANRRGRAEAFLSTLCSALASGELNLPGVSWLGPFPATMEKRAGFFRAQLLLQSHDRRALQQLLSSITPLLEQSPLARQVRWSLDVDPVDNH